MRPILSLVVTAWLAASAVQEKTASPPPGAAAEGSADAGRPALVVRPANQELAREAEKSLQKIRLATDRIRERAKKPEQTRGSSVSLKADIVAAVKLARGTADLADQLTIRGEVDGLALADTVRQARASLDAVVTPLRPYLGSAEGLANAVTRRSKEQLGALRQFDEAIKNKQWDAAQRRLRELQDSADEVGLFVEPSAAEILYGPIRERAAKIAPDYLLEKREALVRKLRDEFAATRPDLGPLYKSMVSIAADVRNAKDPSWNGKPVTGPQCLHAIAASWPDVDARVAQSLAVLYAIGPAADVDLKALRAEYEAGRAYAITMPFELIRADAARIAAADAEARYIEYLRAIPPLMEAVHGVPADLDGASTALVQIAARSPALQAKVERYRDATAETLRWRRRLAARYLKARRSGAAAPRQLRALADGLGSPGAAAGGTPAWGPAQALEPLRRAWLDACRGTPIAAPAARDGGGGGAHVLRAAWQNRVTAEVSWNAPPVERVVRALADELLVTPTQPALTLEATLLLYTAAHGPYVDIEGTVREVEAQSLPDQLWDHHDAADLPAAFSADSFVPPPGFPALVRLRLEPSWIAHDLFVWSAPPAGSDPEPAAANPPPPVAAEPASPAAAPAAARPVTIGVPNPDESKPAAGTSNASRPAASPQSAPVPPKPAAPPAARGGVPF